MRESPLRRANRFIDCPKVGLYREKIARRGLCSSRQFVQTGAVAPYCGDTGSRIEKYTDDFRADPFGSPGHQSTLPGY
jgi:hypothetical protein